MAGPENIGQAEASTRYVFDAERHPVIKHLARHLHTGAVAVEVAPSCSEALEELCTSTSNRL